MRGARRTAVIVAFLAALAIGAVPSVAVAASVTEQVISRLNRQLLYLAVPIAVLVEAILAYTVWRFRDNDEPEPTKENRQLEITWTIATALVLLFVGTASFYVLAQPTVSTVLDDPQRNAEPGNAPEDAVEAHIVTEQWNYTFEYPEENVTTSESLVLPENRTAYLYITSEDVIHSVHVPELGLKQDALPGQYNLLRTEPTEKGEYRLYCAELCGRGHPEMLSTVQVVSEDEYERWLENPESALNESEANESSANGSATDGGP
ncbi:cytochrome c oxidase subunit II [Halopiger aswanensis]|uniref:cytochrome-c oxidase n=1 Tax=Halopiger aswanensis TaxID=148449 RepID=A0A3R7D742_9EURY|nr:cytochrome c oxidase subunit II [Halopiger aswanensis]RKD88066.1 cytochrome c oxidase subunit 2 [Halopiger aswanensis]